MAKSMGLNLAAGTQGYLKSGHRSFEGLEEAVVKNIEATKGLATITKSSLGPNGMNKLVVNHLGKIIVSSDCATIIKELEVQHPAAKILALAAEMQEQEYGDNTNLVVSFAGELLSLALDLLRQGVHQSEIVAGYKAAADYTFATLPSLVCHTVTDPRDEAQLQYAVKSVLAAKQYGNEDKLSELVAHACLTVMPDAASGLRPRVNADSVRIVKLMGGNINMSTVLHGMVLPRAPETTIKSVDQAKVTVFGCGIEAESTETSGTVLIRNAEDMLNYNKSEERALEEVIAAIAGTGTNVVVAGGSVSEMALHFLEKYNLMCLKVVSKWDLRRLCSTVGATALVRLGAATPEEMGACHRIYVREFGNKKATVLEQNGMEDTQVASIVLRSSTTSQINDLERACDDGIHTIKNLCKQPGFLPGAGAVEMEMATRLRRMAAETESLDQYAIRKFGEAFECVPRTLAENSGQDATSLVSQLYTAHQDGQANLGVDIDPEGSGLKDKAAEGVVDLAVTKESAIRLAVDAAITVLRVDQIIMSKPAGGPQAPKQR